MLPLPQKKAQKCIKQTIAVNIYLYTSIEPQKLLFLLAIVKGF